MSNIDDRIVQMRFDNGAFENGVRGTLNTLEKLRNALNFSSSKKGLDDLQATGNRFTMNPVGSAVDGVSTKFLAMATIGITALANITNKVIDTGLQIGKSLTVAPIMDGFREYETNLNSIQTVLANTSDAGKTLPDVNKALAELNTYADKTIYNFSEMARNIGTFTAAGVDLDTSVNAIKGIANLAAISGSNSQQASTAMYQLSQAIASGSVKLMDWNSVVNAGMGGKTFQKALFETGKVMGTIANVPMGQTFDEWTAAGNTFRDSLQDGWITADVLTNTLAGFTGDLTDAQLKAIGYNDEQIAQIQKMGQLGQDAATKVKTMTQLLDTTKEAVGSGWAQTWQLIFGDFDEAKGSFTELSNVITGAVGKSADARNKIISDWKALGGRTVAIDGIKETFRVLNTLIQPIRDAFHQVFPPATGKTIYDLTVKFRDFVAAIKPSQITIDNLRRTFVGIFALFDIGRLVVVQIFKSLTGLFGAVGLGEGGFLRFTASIADFIMGVRHAIKDGTGFKAVIDQIVGVLLLPINLFRILANFIKGLFDGFQSKDATEAADALGRVKDRLEPLAWIVEKVTWLFEKFTTVINFVADKVRTVGEKVGEAIKTAWNTVAEAFSNGNYEKVLDGVNTALLGGLLVVLARFSKGLTLNFNRNTSHNFGELGGMIGQLRGVFGELTNTLKAMQGQLQANTLLTIAAAVGILTASIIALSLIDSEKLTKALSAVGVAMGQLLFAMQILTKVTASAGFIKMPVVAGSMILLATAILVLTAAVKVLSTMDWEELGKGLAGVAGLMLILSLAIEPLSKGSVKMLAASVGLIAIGVALNILAVAVKVFATMSWEEMAKGAAAVGGALLIIAGAMQLMPATLPITAAGLVLVAVALNMLILPLKIFSAMSWDQMAHGAAALGGALLIIAGAMQLMPLSLPITAAGLVVVGAALLIIGKAINSMGDMSWEEIKRGLITMASALVLLTAAVNLMSGAVGGAVAMVIAAGALKIMGSVIKALGKLEWMEIVKGLTAIAGVFAVIGLAGLLLTPVVPQIFLLGAGIALLGSGLALAGVAALAFATAFALVVGLGSAGAALFQQTLSYLIAQIPLTIKQLGLGIVEFAKVIASSGKAFIGAFVTLLTALLQAVIDVVPKLAELITLLIMTGLEIVRNTFPSWVQTGLEMLLSFLHGVEDNIGEIAGTAVNIITNFVDAIADHMDEIVASGKNLIKQMVLAILLSAVEELENLWNAGISLGKNIINGIVEGFNKIKNAIWEKLKKILTDAWDKVKDFFGVNSPSRLAMDLSKWIVLGLVKGLDNHGDKAADAMVDVAETMVDKIRNTISTIPDQINDGIFEPTIKPVLDISQARKDATQIQGWFSGLNPKLGSTSWNMAAGIANDKRQQEEDAASTNDDKDKAGTNVQLIQNNYSPKALEPIDIYRQTKNQLSQVEEALSI